MMLPSPAKFAIPEVDHLSALVVDRVAGKSLAFDKEKPTRREKLPASREIALLVNPERPFQNGDVHRVLGSPRRMFTRRDEAEFPLSDAPAF